MFYETRVDGVLARARAWVSSLPFPLMGYEDWLASESGGQAEIHLQQPVDRSIIEGAIHAVLADAPLRWLDASTVAVPLPTRVLWSENGDDPSTWVSGGDVAPFKRLVERPLALLHRDVGIAKVVLRTRDQAEQVLEAEHG